MQTLATPQPGEATRITLAVEGDGLTLSGKVVYVEPGMGFAVQFVDLPDRERSGLNRLLDSRGSTRTNAG